MQLKCRRSSMAKYLAGTLSNYQVSKAEGMIFK